MRRNINEKVLSILMIGILVFSVVGCSNSNLTANEEKELSTMKSIEK